VTPEEVVDVPVVRFAVEPPDPDAVVKSVVGAGGITTASGAMAGADGTALGIRLVLGETESTTAVERTSMLVVSAYEVITAVSAGELIADETVAPGSAGKLIEAI
jgi:hypothetical protein